MIRELLDWWPLFTAIAGVIGVGGILMVLGLWPVVTSFLIGTKIGRYISLAGMVVGIIFYAFLSGTIRGERKERAKQKAREIEAMKKAVESDKEVESMSRPERRRYLSKWVR